MCTSGKPKAAVLLHGLLRHDSLALLELVERVSTVLWSSCMPRNSLARVPSLNRELRSGLVSCCLCVPYGSAVLHTHSEAIGTRPGDQLGVLNRPWVSVH